MKAKPSGIRLSSEDAAVAKGMLARGDRQHDIAAYFGVNGGRIAEISTGALFSEVEARHDNLPRPGPYLNQVDLKTVRDALKDLLRRIDEMDSKGR